MTNVPDGDQLLGPDFRRVQDVEFKVVFLALRDDLDTKLPLWVSAALDRLPWILAMGVWVLASNFECFIPYEAVHAELGCEVELDKVPLALVVDEREGVDAKALHHTV